MPARYVSTQDKGLRVVAVVLLVVSVLFAVFVAMFGWNAAHVPCEAPNARLEDSNGYHAILIVAIAHAIFGLPTLVLLVLPSSRGTHVGAIFCAICAFVTVFLALCFLILQAGMC